MVTNLVQLLPNLWQYKWWSAVDRARIFDNCRNLYQFSKLKTPEKLQS